MRPCPLTKLDDHVDFVLSDTRHLLEVSDRLGYAFDTCWLCRQLFRGLENRTHLSKYTDGLVGAFWQINFILPREQPVEKPFNLFASNPSKLKQKINTRRRSCNARELERVGPLLMPAQGVPKALKQNAKKTFSLDLLSKTGNSLFHKR
jgi:hypothetical protein